MEAQTHKGKLDLDHNMVEDMGREAETDLEIKAEPAV